MIHPDRLSTYFVLTMCGINAIFAYRSAAAPVDRAELLRTRDNMEKRGPDGAGDWLSDDGRIGLGHRRLAIIDLSPTGAQPMAAADGSLVVTFNGEIYNYRELRDQLIARGRQFRSTSDTEVLLHLYAEFGAAMLVKLRGMFAFALYDAKRRRLLLARDPYGIKPLYYADDGATVRVASQVTALIAGGGCDTAPDAAGWVGFHLFGSVPEPLTTFRAVRSLPAGASVTFDEDGAQAVTHFHRVARVYADAAGKAHATVRPTERRERFRAALLDSVRHHLVADVPVGAFLSAGIDSSVLVGLMRAAGQQELSTVTLAFEDFRSTPKDEAPLAAVVANHYGTRHTTRTVSCGEFLDDLPEIMKAMDQPSIDGINTWFVSKAAKEIGLKVAISGLGGDELLGGYPSFRDVPAWVRKFSVPGRLGLLGAGLREAAETLCVGRLLGHPKAIGLLEYGGTLPGAYLMRRGLFMPWELAAVMDPDMAREGLQQFSPLQVARDALQPDPSSDFARIATLETSLYMRNQLLRDTDWASMAHSIEVRTPLADAHLLQVAAECVDGAGNGLSKRDLAEAPSRALPAAILSRPKTGFGIPTEAWIDAPTSGGSARPLVRGPSRGWARRVAAMKGLPGTQHPNLHTRSPNSFAAIGPAAPPASRTSGGLRVLMLVSDAHGGSGGIARHNCDVLEALSSSEQVAEVVVLPRLVGASLGQLPAKVSYDLSATGSVTRFIACSLRHGLLRQRFDVIHCGHINLMPLTWALCRARGIPSSLVIHGIDAWQPPTKRLTRWAANRASRVISVSDLTLQRFLAWSRVTPGSATVIANTLHSRSFTPAEPSATLLRELDLAGRTVIMSLGRMSSQERKKGFDEVIELMPRLLTVRPDLVYLACGDGDDRRRLEAKAKALGVTHAVRFPGFVREEDKPDYYRLADAFVMPSTGEGFGIVLLEAMSCGIPVVASTLDGTREAVRNGRLGELADPRDSEQLTRAILAALDKPKRVPDGLDYFAFSTFAERWVEAIQDAVSTRSRPHRWQAKRHLAPRTDEAGRRP